MHEFVIQECEDLDVIRELFSEYSQIKGAEICFVSFGEELGNLEDYYRGGSLLVASVDGSPAGCIALRKDKDLLAELKRLYVRPAYRGQGYGRALLDAALEKAGELGFREVWFTTIPAVMSTAYEMYRRKGFQEKPEEEGVVYMWRAVSAE